MNLYIRVLFAFLASLFFLFLFWKKLKEDYAQNQIFSTGIYSLIGLAFFLISSVNFFPKWIFWASFFGSFLGLLFGISKFRLRLYETLEGWVFGFFGILALFYLEETIVRFRQETLLFFSALSILLLLFVIIDRRYKKFTWYKSGKVGFTGLFILGVGFLIRSVVSILLPDMIFFVGKVDAILSGVISFLSFFYLFNLSRNVS